MRVSASVFFGLAFLTVIACIVSFHFLPKLVFFLNKLKKNQFSAILQVLCAEGGKSSAQ